MKKLIIYIVVFLVIIVSAVVIIKKKNKIADTPADTNSNENIMTADDKIKQFMELAYDHEGFLVDVSGGNASGVANATQVGSEYYMLAELFNLPALQDNFFYEGWVVRQGKNMSVISTGKISTYEDHWLNTFMSDQNLLDHAFYVLTLEPDDGDPAPAAHILEGSLERKGK
jgi:hypothetical protein